MQTFPIPPPLVVHPNIVPLQRIYDNHFLYTMAHTAFIKIKTTPFFGRKIQQGFHGHPRCFCDLIDYLCGTVFNLCLPIAYVADRGIQDAAVLRKPIFCDSLMHHQFIHVHSGHLPLLLGITLRRDKVNRKEFLRLHCGKLSFVAQAQATPQSVFHGAGCSSKQRSGNVRKDIPAPCLQNSTNFTPYKCAKSELSQNKTGYLISQYPYHLPFLGTIVLLQEISS